MATTRYTVQNGRREQMKRELIGLVIGTTLLMSGMAFLFSQTLVADGAAVSEAAPDVEAKPVMAATVEPAIIPPPLAPSLTATKADIPALASLDVAVSNQAVAPVDTSVSTPEVSTAVIPEVKTVETAEKPTEETAAATATGSTGWIYAGQFANGKWTEQGLKIGAELPVIGHKYLLSWAATVREHAPGKRSEGGSKLGKVTGNLASGREVTVTQVKKSGSKGHVWLEIGYQ